VIVRALRSAARHVQLAMLHTRRAQLLILRDLVVTDPSPAALLRCEARLADVHADIHLVRLQLQGAQPW
jgi:hypothetical protein